jgi:hypothetical protein
MSFIKPRRYLRASNKTSRGLQPARTSAGEKRALFAALTLCLTVLEAGCNLLTGRAPSDNNGNVSDTVPGFEAGTFTNPTLIDNVYFPQVPGTKRTYVKETDEGIERVVEEVLDETREILGVECRIIRVQEFLNDILIEDTQDWHAQDDDGNVWYMGESVDNYHYDEQGALIDITHEGAWEAGKDVADLGTTARPGYIMLAAPVPGEVYSQEYYEGEAEDIAEIVALNVSVTLADGTTYTCLQTHDFTPLEPDADEYKYYAPGVGLIAEEPLEGGERVELVAVE